MFGLKLLDDLSAKLLAVDDRTETTDALENEGSKADGLFAVVGAKRLGAFSSPSCFVSLGNEEPNEENGEFVDGERQFLVGHPCFCSLVESFFFQFKENEVKLK